MSQRTQAVVCPNYLQAKNDADYKPVWQSQGRSHGGQCFCPSDQASVGTRRESEHGVPAKLSRLAPGLAAGGVEGIRAAQLCFKESAQKVSRRKGQPSDVQKVRGHPQAPNAAALSKAGQ